MKKHSYIPHNYMAILTAPVQQPRVTKWHVFASKGTFNAGLALIGTTSTLAAVWLHDTLRRAPRWWPAIVGVLIVTFAWTNPMRPYTGTYTGEEPPVMLGIFSADHSTYLGCLNCSPRDTDSILNTVSPYTWPTRNTIFSETGRYGDRVSSTSACNPEATKPPVVLDGHGRYYGDVTINASDPRGILTPRDMRWLRRSVCGY